MRGSGPLLRTFVSAESSRDRVTSNETDLSSSTVQQHASVSQSHMFSFLFVLFASRSRIALRVGSALTSSRLPYHQPHLDLSAVVAESRPEQRINGRL